MMEYNPVPCQITTIENYEKADSDCQENFKRKPKEAQIMLLEGRCCEVLKTLEGPYDFIFMDAAKGQYIHFLPEILRLLARDGVLVSDNVLQDGDVIESRFAVTRRNRTIHKRMREYLYTLTHSEELVTAVLPVGDGITLSTRRQRYGRYAGIERNENMRRPELLIPASSLEVLKIAVIYGADAYISEAKCSDPREGEELFHGRDKEGIAFAHAHDERYITANILAHNGDLDGVREYFAELREIKPDALIISDPGVYMIAKEVCPEIERESVRRQTTPLHGTYRFWYEQGAKRVVSARELSLAEIKEIRANIPTILEIETFIHGAMCISYSGRCLLSNYFTGRDANQGACTHPCRWKYAVVEEKRPGEYPPVYENERGDLHFQFRDLYD